MTLLWAVLACMTLAGALIVVMPVLRYRQVQSVSGELVNAMVFKDRLQELDLDLNDGKISSKEHQQLKNELEKTLLGDVAVSQSDEQDSQLKGKWLVWPLLVLIPVLAFVIYIWEGYRPEVKKWFVLQEKMETVMPLMMSGRFEEVEKEGIGVDDFIRILQKRLQSQPEDAKSWYMLGVSYIQMKMPQQSELAFRRATTLEPNNTDYRLGHIQASMMASGGKLTPKIKNSLTQIIQQQPDNPKPYMTLGMAYYQNGDPASAINIWERYMAQEKVDERAAQLLTRSIEVARSELKNNDSKAAASVKSKMEKSSLQASLPTLNVTVNLSEAIQRQLKSTDIVYIYAKAEKGPPMPLAVARQPVSGWPLSVSLSDDDAMTPAMTLSKFDRVVVQARVSSTGNATPQSGDWVADNQVVTLKAGKNSVSMEITTQIP